jgi:hypothetical protein
LTIDDAGAGLAALPNGHPHVAAQQLMHTLPGAIIPPAPEILIDNLPGGKVMRQQAPGTATTQDIEDRIQDLTLGIFLGPSTGLGRWDQMLNQGPLSVTEIGWVWFARFHAPMLLDVVCPKQAF